MKIYRKYTFTYAADFAAKDIANFQLLYVLMTDIEKIDMLFGFKYSIYIETDAFLIDFSEDIIMEILKACKLLN